MVIELLSEAPPAMPTSRPPFDPAVYASEGLGAERLFLDNVVLELVPDVSWSQAKLEYDELLVLGAIDGVSPVLLLESMLGLRREKLRSILFLLLSRGVLAVCAPEREPLGTSGFVRRSTPTNQPTEGLDLFDAG
jgi:hypothetical protein